MRFILKKYLLMLPLSALIIIAGCFSYSPEVLVSTNSEYSKIRNVDIDFDNYWDNLKHLQLNTASLTKLNDDEQKFKTAIESIVNNDLQNAESILKELVSSSSDSVIKSNSKNIIANILFYKSRWKELNDWMKKYGSVDEQNILAEAFLNAGDEKYYFGDNAITLPLTKSSSGCPIIPVIINGVEMNFWLDTGAGMSVLSSDVAEILNIKPIIEGTGEAGTATT